MGSELSSAIVLLAAHSYLAKTNPPARRLRDLRDKNPGDDLLLHGLSHTTIGAVAFHFRVREGIGWFHNAMITRERVEGRDVLFKSPDMVVRALADGPA